MDTVSALIVSLKNAAMAERLSAVVPRSSFTERLLGCFKSIGVVGDFTPDEHNHRPVFIVNLPEKTGLLSLSSMSRPGLRRYAGWRELRRFEKGATIILSTPAGVMTGSQARKRRLGGELIARFE